ncbi:MAG: glycosyltransferase family 4 protein [Salinivenus sp.]
MRIDLVFPVLPPALDGIGDHTAHLAAALAAQHHDVRVLTAQAQTDSIPGVQILETFGVPPRRGIRALADGVATNAPDWLVLQYNPFSYGRWGLNLSLPSTLREIRRRCPKTRIALLVHEPFVPVENWRFALFTTWQRWQLWQLGRAADAVLVAIAPWVDRFQGWFPEIPVAHLPVGSNIPKAKADRTTAREALGMSSDAFVVGLFGSGHASHLLSFTRHAIDRLRSTGRRPEIVYIGSAGDKVASVLGTDALHCTGPLPAPDVSRAFAAMDLYLSPFRKGVSTRRGSFLVGLQHGIPTVSTTGVQTDALLRMHDASAFLLAPDDDPDRFAAQVGALAQDEAARSRIAQNGRALFDSRFAWPRIANTLIGVLAEDPHLSTPRVSTAPSASA